MSDNIHERLKSFLLGIAYPFLLAAVAIPFLTGDRLRIRGHVLTPLEAFGTGLAQLGAALFIHALFYWRYDNHLEIQYAVLALGVILFGSGVFLFFG